jgi:hypothetical protein
VVYSVNRFIVVQFPLKKDEWCSKFKNRLVLCIITFVGLLLYAFNFISTGVDDQSRMCRFLNEWSQIAKLFALIDMIPTVITLANSEDLPAHGEAMSARLENI